MARVVFQGSVLNEVFHGEEENCDEESGKEGRNEEDRDPQIGAASGDPEESRCEKGNREEIACEGSAAQAG